jgi:hypothetical protein
MVAQDAPGDAISRPAVAKLSRACRAQYVSTAQARLVRGVEKGVTRESTATCGCLRAWAAVVGDKEKKDSGCAVWKTGFRGMPDGED